MVANDAKATTVAPIQGGDGRRTGGVYVGYSPRMLDALHRAFHEEGTRPYRLLHSVIWTLVGLSVVVVCIELALTGHDRPFELKLVDDVILGLFAIELVLRVASYRPPALDFWRHGYLGLARVHVVDRIRFLLSPMILIDLITVLALVPALRGLRVLRLLRLLKVRDWFRHTNPLEGTLRAFVENRLLYFAAYGLVAVGTVLGGMTIYLIEGVGSANPQIASPLDGMWWAIVTLTTVGFGDIAPVTGLGRVVAAFLMVAGMFVLALFAGIVGRTLMSSVLTIREEQFRMSGYTDHVVICGYHAGARMLLDAVVSEPGFEDRELVVFARGERPQDIPPELTWVEGDPTKESELGKVRLTHAGSVIVVGDRRQAPQAADATTILTVFTIRSWMARRPESAERRRPLYVVAEILDEENVRHARTAGADEVIESTKLGFSLLAHAIAMPGTAEAVGELAAVGGHSVYVGRPSDGVELPARFADVARRLKAERGVLLIGIRSEEGHDELNPSDDTTVAADSGLVYIAEQQALPTW